MFRFLILLLLTFYNSILSIAYADQVILKVEQVFDKKREKIIGSYTLNDLSKFNQSLIITKTTWTPKSKFSGPRLYDLLVSLNGYGKNIKIETLDDYKTNLSWNDIKKYQPILATHMNGNKLSIDSYGPLWVIFPVDNYPEFKTLYSDSKLAWQVKKVILTD